jgi:tripartite-type tricarboxylate transporter receptor subunit TctC
VPAAKPVAKDAPSPKPTAVGATAPVVPTTAAAAKPVPAAPSPKPAAAGADAKVIEEFYRGKTITIVVGSSAGGGFDVYGRMVGRHLAKHIPGDPTIIVENRPGAGSLIAANSVYQTAPRDGTVIVHFIGAQIIQQLLGNPEVQFDARQYNWLGAPTKDTIACYARTDSGFDTMAQATGSRQLIMGGEAPG